ncbi:MAG: hypothetical protein RJA70_1549 [Pseudomonadota bacterium]|jgi:tetratricopeptide (TPR) repeat protein
MSGASGLLRGPRLGLLLACGLWLRSGFAWALDEEQALGRAALAVRDAEVGITEVLDTQTPKRPATPERRIAAGDLFLRNKDYASAITLFNQVIELHRQKKATDSAHADALGLLGDAYFKSDQLLSARRTYRELTELGNQAPYSSSAGRALGRLVDIALLTSRLEDLDFVFEQMARLKGPDPDGALAYGRGKAYFSRGEYGLAQQALRSLPSASSLLHQAQYLLGVMEMKQALQVPPVSQDPKDVERVPGSIKRFAGAVIQFQRVTQLKVKTPEQQHVVDLAWMALGRLFYEVNEFRDSADAFSHVVHRSPEYPTMLFELAWVFVRQEQFEQAERALEVLSVVSPETLEFADGSLLRADLNLRSKQFDEALRLYQSVHSRFDPIRAEVDEFVATNDDPAVYYDRLVENRLGIETTNGLPGVVFDWVREAAADERVFALIDNVGISQDLIESSRDIAGKMGAVLGSSTRAKAFPDLQLRLQTALGLSNQIALAFHDLSKGLDTAGDSSLAGRIADVRQERRGLSERMERLPVTPADFVRRDASGLRQWTKISHQVQQLTLEADKLQAVINGLRRLLSDAEQMGAPNTSTNITQLRDEVALNEKELDGYRVRIEATREAIERGRIQIGFGDSRYISDKKIRERFEKLFLEEVQLASQGAAGPGGRAFAVEALPLVERALKVLGKLRGLSRGFEYEIRERSDELLKVVETEAQNIEAYASRLEAFDRQARVLVGEVAKRSFGLVRERLKSIVLKADVGVVQHAWELRQAHLDRVQKLQRERATEQQYLNDELQEVMFDGRGEP